MPRSRTIKRSKKTKKKSGFLPESLQAFIARRLVDTIAALFLGSGLMLLLSLVSYNQADPSVNTASTQSPTNWMGQLGADMSDIVVQAFGVAAFLLPLILLSWGARLFKRNIVKPFSLRLLSTVIAATCGSVALAQIPSDWTAHAYAGGAIGTLARGAMDALLADYSHIAWWSLAPISAALASAATLFACAVTMKELRFAGALTKHAIITATIFCVNRAIAFHNWVSHYNNPDYQPKPLFNFKLALPKLETETVETKPAKVETAKAAPVIEDSKPAPLPAQDKPQGNIPVVKPKARNQGNNQASFNLDGGDWELPGLKLIDTPPETHYEEKLNEDALRKNAQLLQNVLADFKIEGDIVSIHPGPVVTLYELEPAPGTKSSRVISLADDIARSMAAISVRCAVVPGRNVIGIEIPNKTRQFVFMQELLASSIFEKSKAHLPLILGKDIGGKPILADLAKMPHLLVAGTTGSGKSVAVNTMILSLLYRLPPEKCRMIMIDPKMLELSVYDDIPHLLSPVVTEPGKAVVALKWTVAEMENRYRAMSKLGVRNIEGYNERMREALKTGEEITENVATGFDETGAPTYEKRPMEIAEIPYIVVVVDEFADLMLVAGKDVENAIQRLAQMARAAGIHLIMATQRPSVDVITGVIKANFPTRISFQVTSKVDSRTILGEGGAEQLLGMGDMLYMAPGGKITRVHGPFVSDNDVEKVTGFLKKQAKPAYLEDITNGEDDFGDSDVMNAMFGDGQSSSGSDVDELYDQAVAVVAREGKASTSFIQRHLQIGYNRAARIVEEMERQGVISPATATGKRNVLISDYSDV